MVFHEGQVVWNSTRSSGAGARRWNAQKLFSEYDETVGELVTLENYNLARKWLQKLKDRVDHAEPEYNLAGDRIKPRKTNQEIIWENVIRTYEQQGGMRQQLQKELAEKTKRIRAHTAREIAEYTGEQRYEIISPVTKGKFVESVRDLQASEVASLKSRGYTLRRVTKDTALMRAITIPKDVRFPSSFSKRARIGIGAQRITFRRKEIPTSVILKSFYNPRNVFMEQNSDQLFEELYYDPRRKRYINISKRMASALRKRGWKLYKQRRGGESKKPSGTVQRQRQRGLLQHEQGQDVDRSVQQMNVELNSLKAWIEEINQRTSRQLSELGESTTARRGEISTTEKRLEEHQKWIDEINTRVSQQLVDLGAAVTDTSKAIEVQKAEKVVQDVQKGSGGFMGGITSFFTTPSNLILIAIVVIMLIMIKMK